MKCKCGHFVVGIIHSKVEICLLSILYDYCCNLAHLYWVGNGEPPAEEKEKILKKFRKFRFCPKCGEKVL